MLKRACIRREDVAESQPWIAVRYRLDRVSKEHAEKVLKAPNL